MPQETASFLKPFFPKTLFSIENAPSQTLSGKIASMSGSVAWQLRTADYATLINSPVKLNNKEKQFPLMKTEKRLSIFPQSEHDVFPNTQVNFIQTLPANFVIEQKQGISTYTKNGNIPVRHQGA